MGTRLIQEEDPGSAEDGAGQAYELFVAVTQYITSVFQLEVQFVWKLFNQRLETDLRTQTQK